MAIATEFDASNAVLWVRPSSTFSIAELTDYFTISVADQRLAQPFVEVVSLSGVDDFNLRVDELQTTAPLLGRFIDETGVEATIFVGAPGLQFGVANMLAGLLAVYRPRHATLTSADEAQVPMLIGRVRDKHTTET